MKNYQDCIGKKYITNEGYEIEITEYINSTNCTIKFNDGTILKNVSFDRIKKGAIKNYNNKSIDGVGYIGYGKYSSKDKIPHKLWKSVINRVYSTKSALQKPTYKDVTVCEEWHCFQNFAEWWYEKHELHMENWQLDKDIIVKGNKIYSPQTCCFVPKKINTLLVKCDKVRSFYCIGVVKRGQKFQTTFSKEGISTYIGTFNTIEEAFQAYKTAKEVYIKEVAKEFIQLLENRVYQALINYKVEITD